MKIGVLSDTHLHSAEELPWQIIEAFSEVDLIVHTGDFVMTDVLDGLREIGDVKAVRGNMDCEELRKILPEKETLIVSGKRIGIIHGSGAPWGIENRLRGQFDQVDGILYGHTHQVNNQVIGGVLFFNPGQAKNSFGILQVDDDMRGQIIKVGR